MKLSVVIPVHNGGENLSRCLAALKKSTRVPEELIVVDDASTDDSGACAAEGGAHVIRIAQGPQGPAFARNRGAEQATGDVLVFLDADVSVHPNTLGRIERYLTTHSEIVGLFGSYDDDPPARRTVSLYKNLQHHWLHQHARREASTFWAGCGAIRREAFRAAGGFHEGYVRPSVEDIELGMRLHQAGARVHVCPDVQVAHLKQWTLIGLLRTDIFDRAVPWGRLILDAKEMPPDLNVGMKSRASAAIVWLDVTFLILSIWYPWLSIALPAGAAVLFVLNRDLYAFFAQRGGLAFAVRGIALHWFYLLYSSAVFGILLATRAGARPRNLSGGSKLAGGRSNNTLHPLDTCGRDSHTLLE